MLFASDSHMLPYIQAKYFKIAVDMSFLITFSLPLQKQVAKHDVEFFFARLLDIFYFNDRNQNILQAVTTLKSLNENKINLFIKLSRFTHNCNVEEAQKKKILLTQ